MRPYRFIPAGLTASVLAMLLAALSTAAPAPPNHYPWTASQEIMPSALAREIKAGEKPLVVCVGFPILYEAAHIPGARIEGPASQSAELQRLEAWAHSVPRNATVVIYCGCCPLVKCPNIRPAYRALERAGVKHVRVLMLENSFARDWVDKGYPTQRGK